MRNGHLREKGKAMPQAQCHRLWRCMAFAAGISVLACHTGYAKETTASIKEAEQYVAKGNLKAAEIELRNAIRESPQDPVLHARLAEVNLQLGDVASARRVRPANVTAMRKTTYRYWQMPCFVRTNSRTS